MAQYDILFTRNDHVSGIEFSEIMLSKPSGSGYFLTQSTSGVLSWSKTLDTPVINGTVSGTAIVNNLSSNPSAGKLLDALTAKQYIDGIVTANDAMVFKGTLGTGGTITALPSTHAIGWAYKVITAGTYAGQVCEIGDLILSITSRSGSGNTNNDWIVVQANVDGAVTGPASSINNRIAVFSGTSGKVIKMENLSISDLVAKANVISDINERSSGTIDIARLDATIATQAYASSQASAAEAAAKAASVPTTRTVNGKALSANISLSKSDVGLGNVNNTADADKPVSSATQTALNLKAPIASPTFTGTVSGITKSMVGLGNVDNVSAATIRGVITIDSSGIINNIGTASIKVDNSKIVSADLAGSGKVWASLPESGAQVNTVTSVAGKTGAVTLTKSNVGLDNVDNLSAASIRSGITVNASGILTGIGTSGIVVDNAKITKSSLGLDNVENLSAEDIRSGIWVAAPASKTAAGTAGQLARDNSFFYVCRKTGSTGNAEWVRSAMSYNW